MTLWAIVPVKPLKRGKSRLSGVLSESERTSLNKTMLINTLKTLRDVEEIDTILVVSRDPSALAISRDYSAKTVLEDGNPDLNTALRRASTVARAYLANEILVLPADLPLIKPEDIRAFIRHSGKPPEVLIAPDRRRDGTNALFINPADLIEFYYGPGSFEIHKRCAEKAHARLEIIETDTFGLDLDLPEDLEVLKGYKVELIDLTEKTTQEEK
jgi:2-phospho-L-lactate guanylyltransferase